MGYTPGVETMNKCPMQNEMLEKNFMFLDIHNSKNKTK